VQRVPKNKSEFYKVTWGTTNKALAELLSWVAMAIAIDDSYQHFFFNNYPRMYNLMNTCFLTHGKRTLEFENKIRKEFKCG